MKLLLFLIQVSVISITGAMQPGPVTTTAITMGAKNRWAGVLIAVGHGIVEFPLMILIILGLGTIFQKPAAQISIGLVGGLVLLYMALSIFKSRSVAKAPQSFEFSTGKFLRGMPAKNPALLAGIVLTASNPYFLFWWATVGLKLAINANKFGIYAFALFAITHWLVDLFWVTALSLAAFHGTSLLGPKSLTIILKICAAAMLFFAGYFIYNSTMLLIRT
jgi:threonine/homoserine/homoserine lactone efflux protein